MYAMGDPRNFGIMGRVPLLLLNDMFPFTRHTLPETAMPTTVQTSAVHPMDGRRLWRPVRLGLGLDRNRQDPPGVPLPDHFSIP